jgi:capsular polysaccharide biosynthesis protein
MNKGAQTDVSFMEETGRGLDHLIGVARRWWLMLVTGTLLGAGIAGLVTAASGSEYEAEAVVLVDQPALTNDPGQGTETVQKLASLMPTYAQIVTSDVVLSGVVAELDSPLTVSALRSRTTVNHLQDTLTLEILITADSEGDAGALAAAIISQFRDTASELGSISLFPEATATVVLPIQSPEVTNVTPSPFRTLVLAGILGFGLAAVAAFVFDRA